MPLLIIGFLAVLQLTLAYSTAQSAATAARAAARSLSLAPDPARADVTGTARAAVPGWVAQHLSVTSGVRNGVATVHVTCRIPLFLPGVATVGEVHRSATFPTRSEEAPWD
jgi:Flp pilus assembly protein TadG